MELDENVAYRLNQHPEILIQLQGRAVPVRYYTVEKALPIAHTETKGTILFVHGLGPRAPQFARVARCFVHRGYRTFLLELPGYDARSWGCEIQLDEYTISVFAQYIQRAIEALEAKHQVRRLEWTIWGHSMGASIVYQAMAQNPAMFLQFDYIVLESPAFANRLAFLSNFILWLSKSLHKSVIGRYIGRKLIKFYILDQHYDPGVFFYMPREIGGFADSFAIFHQNVQSMKHPSNNFDPKILQEVGRERLLWIWSPKDQAINAKPPEVIPEKQQIRLPVDHNISLVAPQQVCLKVDQKFAEFKSERREETRKGSLSPATD